ncbi:MAG: PH domain-containing protein [Dehalococcoidia bacterium]|nr:PH domain-containing protein [Dehalococcoidia bacterium]
MATVVELQPGERQVLLCRRHWIALYPRLLVDLLIAAIPVAVLLWATSRAEGVRPQQIAIAASVVWVIVIAVRAYFHWYRWRNDVWLITNQRLVDSIRPHWFHREVSSADLVDIQDVAMLRSGVLQTSLDFGDLNVQTASEQQRFVLAKIADPAAVLTILDRTRDEARRGSVSPA